jgi:hypothetical protein
VRGDTVLLAEKAQQQVLSTDEVLLELGRLLSRPI